MAKINIRPLDDRVVVKPTDAEEMTAGGIVLPDAAREKPQKGTVLAVGPGKLLDSGERGTPSPSVGVTGEALRRQSCSPLRQAGFLLQRRGPHPLREVQEQEGDHRPLLQG